MLRMVFATAVLAACHPAPAVTVVHAAPIGVAPITHASPVRQDFVVQLAAMPLAEVVTTGHECRATPAPIPWPTPAPADDDPLVPLNRRPLLITAGPVSTCRALPTPLH